MSEPRLKTEIRVTALLRRAQAGGAFATVVRKGDPDAGAFAVKVYLGGGKARLFIMARDLDGRLVWRSPLSEEAPESAPEMAVDAWLQKEAGIDPDLWIIEIEDSAGRSFLEDGSI